MMRISRILVILALLTAAPGRAETLYLDRGGAGDLKVHVIGGLIANSYLVETSEGLFLIDTGAPGNEKKILREMSRAGRSDLKLIYITHAHFDHYGSAYELRRKTGAPIAVHQKDAGYMSRGETPLKNVRSLGILGKLLFPLVDLFWQTKATPPDILVKEGDSFEPMGLTAVVLHMPGHTPGSSGLLVEGKYIFAGDLFTSRPWLRLQSYFADDWNDIARSFERLKALQPDLVFPGHGRPVRGDELSGIEYD